ncbi:unnamed protein product [Durusdinium trenchii]|uniref:Uncharacterized protein n=2 Tax=Durusdinium trenchii TaxID=1381693 RepID=A0ABP0IC63_9DINO
MIENGMYTMMSAIIIAIYFQEHPKIQAYFGFVLILLGVLLAQKSSSSKGKGEFLAAVAAPQESSEASSSTDARHERCGASRFSAPSCFGRCGAVALAMCAGSCWGFGPLGKKIGVHGSEDHQRQAWAACTYFVYMLSTIFVPLLRVLTAHGRREALEDSSFRCRLLGTVLCGLVSGFGGMLSTFAFAQEGYYSGALISTVENGIYTVFGAVLITVVFREKLSQRQLNLGVGAGGSEELKPEQLCLGSTCMVEKPQGPQVCMSDSRFDGTLVISVAIFNNPWALGDGQGR